MVPGCSGSESSVPVTYQSARQSRNLAEKQRRDNLNAHITVLQNYMGDQGKKSDKINTLRATSAFLRMCYVFNWKGRNNEEMRAENFDPVEQKIRKLILHASVGNDGFHIVITSAGSVVWVSDHIEQHLGYNKEEVKGQPFYTYVYSADCQQVQNFLTSKNSKSLPTITEDIGCDDKQTMYFRIATRSNSRREDTRYEFVSMSGIIRLNDTCRKRKKNSGDNWQLENRSNNDVVFIGTITLLNRKKIEDIAILDSTKDEYVTRHLIDGKIIFCDYRIATIAGYLPEEVSGLNAFNYIHKDDLQWIMMVLKSMYNMLKYFGKTCYRLRTKNDDIIYLRTHGYLEFNRKDQDFLSFVCVNTLVTKEEGERLMNEMKEAYSGTYEQNAKSLKHKFDNDSSDSSDSLKISEYESPTQDPEELELAIQDLVSGIQAPETITKKALEIIEPPPELEYKKVVAISKAMPPANFQAQKIGVDDPGLHLYKRKKTNHSVLKNKVDGSVSECTSEDERSVVELTHKRVSESEETISPFSNKSDGTSDSSSFNITVTDKLQRSKLRRLYDDTRDLASMPVKRKILDLRENLKTINIDDSNQCIIGELDYPTYIQDVNQVTAESTENQCMDTNERLLNSSYSSNSEIVDKLFNNLPLLIHHNGTPGE
ncbi:circadian locomoter output cycles protein kaput isoform X2 [Copidosoma floridanum]|uniref:circadian locomoter output cycles protein kaput isoform X2 n=1 Tax=Copidosoma floridanum TaxID=29053 RepID=UPI0006C9615B|nr:circadian locomoter output cycles protein kaput isoform X2 [Copidosoma floridanum]